MVKLFIPVAEESELQSVEEQEILEYEVESLGSKIGSFCL